MIIKLLFNTTDTMLKDRGLEPSGKVQKIVDSEVLRRSTPYVPFKTALALSESLLRNYGVCRVHGGGFAGTIQAFVKNDFVSNYKEFINKIFGENSCHVLKVRKYGGIKVM